MLSDSPNTILPLWDVGGCDPHSDLDADLTGFVSAQLKSRPLFKATDEQRLP